MSDDSDATTSSPEEKPAPKRRRHHRAGAGMLPTLLLAAFLVFITGLMLTGRAIPLPDWALERVEATLNKRLSETGVGLGGAAIALDRDMSPRVRMQNVALGDRGGGAVAVLNSVEAAVSPGALLQGKLAFEDVTLDGAQITIRRGADGRFAFQAAGAEAAEGRSLSDMLALIDRAFGEGPLASLREIEAQSVVISLEDARSGRIWQATNARMALRRTGEGITLSVASDVFNGTDDVAEVQLSFVFDPATRDTSLGVRLDGAAARDIALQSPALSWLGLLDAPISGAVRATFDGSEGLTSLAGTLDIDAGELVPGQGSEPLSFDAARAYFDFDPARQRLDFDELEVIAERLTVDASGHAYLAEVVNGWPTAFIGQLDVERLLADGGDFFEAPLELADLRADLRLRPDPFRIDIGSLVLDNGGTPVRGRGWVAARADGWHLSVDAETARIAPDTVIRFWPTRVSPITRGWLKQNVREGELRAVTAAIRKVPHRKPDFGLNFDFHDGKVQFLKEMPPIVGGHGRGTMSVQRFDLVLEEGRIIGPGGVIDAAGSSMRVPDVRPKPAMGEFDIRAAGPLTTALEILNNPPLRLMDRARRPTALADATANVRALVTLPLEDGIEADEVTYAVDGVLNDVSSEVVAPGRVLTSERLRLVADGEMVGLEGRLALDGVPATARWRQPIGEGGRAAGSVITGTVELSRATIDAFDLPLPDELVSGRATGDYTLTVKPDAPTALRLSSDLTGATMAIDALGWRKAAGARGELELEATLGDIPEVPRLAFSAPGLALDGRLDFGEAGEFTAADFTQIRVGDWLDARALLTPRGGGRAPSIALRGGRIDLRKLPDRSATPGGERAPIDVSLDALVVSETITLAPLIGRIEAGRAGLNGNFEGRINGQTPVRGTLAPANAGTAIRVQSNDAGGVLRSMGLTPNGRGGGLDIVLTPVGGARPGTYDGQFLIEDFRMVEAPVMAALLDAISVVGLIDQLSGPGLRFATVDGQFRLSPEGIVLREAAAVGGSLGISASGGYDFASNQMDFQGVISPVYFLNAIGSALTRRGEGLFGFNYRLSGPTSAPVVGVNPLSILTPGMFREIFRAAPPTN